MSSCAASRCQHSSSIAAQSLISDLSPGVTRVCDIETNLTHHIVTENSLCPLLAQIYDCIHPVGILY